MKFTEQQLIRFVQPISDYEDQKCIKAIELVRDSLKGLGYVDDNVKIARILESSSFNLKMRSTIDKSKIKIFVQGSYANNTNIRLNSDVDIAVVKENAFYPQYRSGITNESYGFLESSESPKTFKDMVQECLVNDFGNAVERRDKSIHIKGNESRQDTDTVPAFRNRDYTADYNFDEDNFVGGITIVPDKGAPITNYPEQHILEGIKKNNRTNHYYKKMVRIMKHISLKMSELGYKSAENTSSFGLESLIWNIPDKLFLTGENLGDKFGYIIVYLNLPSVDFISFYEANGIKKLCTSMQEANSYKLFIRELLAFYEF